MSGKPVARAGRQKRSGFGDDLRAIVFALLVAAGIHSFLFENFFIPSGSMVPTLLVGDHVFVDKFAYGYSRFSLPFAPDIFSGRIFGRLPRRGDVVVFAGGNDPGITLIKRVIGLPGDTIQVTAGQLYINGALVPRIADGAYTDTSGPVPILDRRYSEVLPGKTHIVIKQSDDGFANNTPLYKVPPGELFMMGDNRDNSADSRFLDDDVGYVPMQNVIGKAVLIYFSIAWEYPPSYFWEWPSEIRWGRLLTRIT